MEEIFEDNIEAESRIIRMIFRIIKPKFGQKWTYPPYGHIIYCWKDILNLISVMGIFVHDIKAESYIIKMNFCITSPQLGKKGLTWVPSCHILRQKNDLSRA